MNRFELRLKKRLQGPKFAAGYREMEGHIALLRALEQAREQMHISKAELAKRLGRARPSLSRLLTGPGANPTLETIAGICAALGIRAQIRLCKGSPRQPVLSVETRL